MNRLRSSIDVGALKVGVTIESILDEYGIQHRRKSCACPVHHGDNRTAFSFNDESFYCFTRGCKGDVITLLQSLAKTDFQGAVAILARRKGVTLPVMEQRRTRRLQNLHPLPAPKPETAKDVLRRKLATNQSFRIHWTRRLRELREKRRLGLIGGCDYYTQSLIADEHLETLDAKEAALHYKIKRVRD